jgi:hypothetical protein
MRQWGGILLSGGFELFSYRRWLNLLFLIQPLEGPLHPLLGSPAGGVDFQGALQIRHTGLWTCKGCQDQPGIFEVRGKLGCLFGVAPRLQALALL